jgi:hypothetical protein
MRRKRLPRHVAVSGLLAAAILAVPAPASAKDCAAWNNWCRPACGDWNGYCAGQSLPTIIGRMAPQSFFADPWWHGQHSETPYQEPRWQGNAPKAKVRAHKGARTKSAKANAASSR